MGSGRRAVRPHVVPDPGHVCIPLITSCDPLPKGGRPPTCRTRRVSPVAPGARVRSPSSRTSGPGWVVTCPALWRDGRSPHARLVQVARESPVCAPAWVLLTGGSGWVRRPSWVVRACPARRPGHLRPGVARPPHQVTQMTRNITQRVILAGGIQFRNSTRRRARATRTRCATRSVDRQSIAQRAVLEGWVRCHASTQALAQRSRIVLECADGHSIMEVLRRRLAGKTVIDCTNPVDYTTGRTAECGNGSRPLVR